MLLFIAVCVVCVRVRVVVQRVFDLVLSVRCVCERVSVDRLLGVVVLCFVLFCACAFFDFKCCVLCSVDVIVVVVVCDCGVFILCLCCYLVFVVCVLHLLFHKYVD